MTPGHRMQGAPAALFFTPLQSNAATS